MAGILVPIALFLCIAAVLIVYFVTRNNERRMFIEKGLTPEQMRELMAPHGRAAKPLSSLKWGLLGIFLGLGLLAGGLLHEYYGYEEFVYFASMFIGGGIGLVIFYVVASKKLEKAA